jgi:hypothetical protein
MTPREKIFNDVYNEGHTTEELLTSAPIIFDYWDDMPADNHGALDIGLGLGGFTLWCARAGMEVHTFDKEPYYAERVDERIKNDLGNIETPLTHHNGILPDDPLPPGPFAVIQASNILHFLTPEQCVIVEKQVYERLIDGGLFSIVIHSKKHPSNVSSPDGYFKTFFDKELLSDLFPSTKYQTLYFAEHDRLFPKKFTDLRFKAYIRAGANEAKLKNAVLQTRDCGIILLLKKKDISLPTLNANDK